MKRISLLEYAKNKGIKTRETVLKAYERGEIENAYKDEVTGAISVVVPEFEGDTEISDELKTELENIQNKNRITLKEFASNLGMSYNKCYITFIDTNILKNIFKDSVGGKISVFITDDMYDIKVPEKGNLKPLKEVADFLHLKTYELREMVKTGKITYKRDTSVFSDNGHIFFSLQDVENYIKNKKKYTSFVTETFDKGYLLSLDDVCTILKKKPKTIIRLADDKILQVVNYESNNEKYEQASGKKYTVESVKDFFYHNADYKHDARILTIYPSEIKRFFLEPKIKEEDNAEKLKAEEIFSLSRIPLRIWAKKAKRSYQSLLNDFYDDNLINAGQDPVTKDIFILKDEKNPKRIISLESIKKAFNFSKNRITLVKYAKDNNLSYNKAKIMAKNGEIAGALYDPICNSFSVDLDIAKTSKKALIPYIRLDANQDKELFKPQEEMSFYAFYTQYGYDMSYIRLDINKGHFVPTKRNGNRMFFSLETINRYLAYRKEILEQIINVLKSKDEFSLEEMEFLTQRDKTFITRTATRRKWFVSKEKDETYSKDEYINFVRDFDNYWNDAEKELILSSI